MSNWDKLHRLNVEAVDWDNKNPINMDDEYFELTKKSSDELVNRCNRLTQHQEPSARTRMALREVLEGEERKQYDIDYDNDD